MADLHTVNKSPFEKNSLEAAIKFSQAGSAILLIEDGVYALRKNAAAAEKLQAALGKHKVYALEPDLKARGLAPESALEGVSLVDYDGFVELATEYDKLQSWL